MNRFLSVFPLFYWAKEQCQLIDCLIQHQSIKTAENVRAFLRLAFALLVEKSVEDYHPFSDFNRKQLKERCRACRQAGHIIHL